MINNYFINVSHNESLLKNFQTLYQQKSNVSLSLEYLKQGHPMLFVRKGKIIGGYVLNTQAPYRYLSIFDEQQKEILLKSHLLKEEELIEITCIWMNQRITSFAWVYYYLFMFLHTLYLAISLNKKRIIGGSVLPKIQLVQRQILTKPIYISFIKKGQELIGKSDGLVMIYYNSVIGFCSKLLYLFSIRMFFSKIFRKKIINGR